jgi:hypothetical protein
MRHLSAITVALLVLPAAALGSELDIAARDYGFDAWQGKGGVLRQGVALGDLDLPGFEVKSVRKRLATSGETILRFGEKNSSRHAFEVAVMVADGVQEAQEHLLGFLGTSTMQLPGAGAFGIQTGDVAFATAYGEVVEMVAFTRNNVYVRVTLVEMPAGTCMPDLVPLAAERIDALIVHEEVAKGKADLEKPRIEKLSAASPVTGPGQPVEVFLSVTDPRGEAVDLLIDEGGGMVYEEGGRRFFVAEKPLDYTVTVYAVNEHFLVSSRSLAIRVVE